MGCKHKSNGKAWGWIFPPLAEAREVWRARAGGDWEWLAPDITDWARSQRMKPLAVRCREEKVGFDRFDRNDGSIRPTLL
jgi:hypothetical protein